MPLKRNNAYSFILSKQNHKYGIINIVSLQSKNLMFIHKFKYEKKTVHIYV